MSRLILILAVSMLAGVYASDESWVNPPAEAVTGVEHHTFASALMKRDVGYNIYLPPQYKNTEQRFPVVYYLAGRTDSESNHLKNALILHDAIVRGDVPPMILVYTFSGRIQFYTDAPDGSVPGESLIIKELIPHIDATYRTIARKEGRALNGWSMGGYGAVKFACKHPDLFCAIVAVAGGFVPLEFCKTKIADTYQAAFGSDAERFERESAPTLLRTRADDVRGKVAMRLICGTKDGSLPWNRAIHATLDELKIPHEYEEIDGLEHNPGKMYAANGLKCYQFIARSFKEIAAK